MLFILRFTGKVLQVPNLASYRNFFFCFVFGKHIGFSVAFSEMPPVSVPPDDDIIFTIQILNNFIYHKGK